MSGRSKVLCPKVSAITTDAALPNGYVLKEAKPSYPRPLYAQLPPHLLSQILPTNALSSTTRNILIVTMASADVLPAIAGLQRGLTREDLELSRTVYVFHSRRLLG